MAAIVVAGIWFTGAEVTNNFTASMLLSAAWMGLAGVACLVIALRRRDLALPVLGAYVLTATVAGAYLGSSIFLDDEVDEQVATAAPASPPGAQRDGAGSQEGGAESPSGARSRQNVRIAVGSFTPLAHLAKGNANMIRLAEGGRVLTFTDFEVDNGPDLRVYLVAGKAAREADVKDFKDLGALKGNRGRQQYEIPRGTDVDRYATAMIWCRAFSVAFARASLK